MIEAPIQLDGYNHELLVGEPARQLELALKFTVFRRFDRKPINTLDDMGIILFDDLALLNNPHLWELTLKDLPNKPTNNSTEIAEANKIAHGRISTSTTAAIVDGGEALSQLFQKYPAKVQPIDELILGLAQQFPNPSVSTQEVLERTLYVFGNLGVRNEGALDLALRKSPLLPSIVLPQVQMDRYRVFGNAMQAHYTH